MSKKLLTPLVLLFFLLLGVIFPLDIVHAADIHDVTFGTKVTDSINSINKRKIYKLTLPGQGKIEINMNLYFRSVEIDLKDANSNEIVHDYLSVENPLTSKAWSKSIDLEAGTYYFTVSNYYAINEPYNLIFNFITPNSSDIEPNNNVLTAQSITLNSSPTTGYLSWNDSFDIYKFVVSKTGKVNINLNSQFDYMNISLLNTNDTELMNESLFDYGEELPRTWNQSLYLDSGTYYFKVWSSYERTGTYTLNVNFIDENLSDLEPNNSISTAQSLTLNSIPIMGCLYSTDALDIYKIIVPKIGKIDLNILSQFNELTFYLEDDSSAQLESFSSYFGSAENPEKCELSIDLMPGTYYLKVTNAYSGSGLYSVNVNFTDANNSDIEPNNDISTAQELNLDSTPLGGCLSSSDSLDMYKLQLISPGKLSINMVSQFKNINVSLEDINGVDVINHNFTSGSFESLETWNPSIYLEAGTYYFKVSSYCLNDEIYSLKTNFSPIYNDDNEPNNIKENAQLLMIGSYTDTGFLSMTDDLDIYKFSLPTPGKINIDITSNVNELFFDLEDSNGISIYSTPLSLENYNSSWSIPFDLEQGTYYVKISKYSVTDTGTYTINANNYIPMLTDDIEPNNNNSNAQLLNLDYSLTRGYFSYTDSIDVYKIVISNASKIKIDVSSEEVGAYVHLKDVNNNKIDSAYLRSFETPWLISWTPTIDLAAGTYYLTLDSTSIGFTHTGEYNIRAVKYPQVTFNSNSGSLIAPEVIPYNTRLVNPTNPTKDNYIFGGWYKESTLQNLFDFQNTPITKDITLYAKWLPLPPKNVKIASVNYNSIQTSWDSVTTANGYEIYRAPSSTGTYTKVGETTYTSFTNTGLATGTTYYYKIRSFIATGTTRTYSNFSSIVNATPALTVPVNLKVASTNYNGAKIDWSMVSGALGYEIYKSTSSTGTYIKAGEVTSASNSFIDTGLTSGTTYYYKVKAYTLAGTTKIYSNYSSIVNVKVISGVSVVPQATSINYNSIKINWSSVNGSSGYEIYRSTSNNGIYTKVGETNTTTFTNTGLQTGSVYYYQVRAYTIVGTAKAYTNCSVIVKSTPIPTVPINVQATSTDYNGIKITWSSVSGATGYEIYRSTSSTGTYIKTGTVALSSTSFIDTGLAPGVTYYYKVMSYTLVGTIKIYSNYSSVVNTIVKPGVPLNLKATSTISNTIQTSWTAVNGANGYEIWRSTSSTGVYTKVGETTSTAYTNIKLPARITYYYKIRSFKVVGSTRIYSNYSSVAYAIPIVTTSI